MTRGSTRTRPRPQAVWRAPPKELLNYWGPPLWEIAYAEKTCGLPKAVVQTMRVSLRIEVDGTCTPCREGLDCPVGSTLRKLKENTAGASQTSKRCEHLGVKDPRHPRLRPSHFSTNEDPFEIYRCLTGCPGGAPGICAGSRTGIMCSGCPSDFFLKEGVPGLGLSWQDEDRLNSKAP